MAEITAAAVNDLRRQTGVPMMDCKKALADAAGDMEKAKDLLRERGIAKGAGRADRETAFGRFGLHFGSSEKAGAIVELKCESAPVTQNEEFIQFCNDLAKQMAAFPDIKTADDLLAKPSPSKAGMTLGDVKNDMFNRIREVFNVGRIGRLEGATGGYSHNSGTVSGVLIAIDGASDEAAKDICMHIAAMRPKATSKEEIDPALIEKERTFLKEQALKEGKPANIVDKMVEGRLKQFYAEHALLEQPFVKDDKQTVAAYAASKGLKVKKFIHWELGRE
jgi:elongation factor Ts